jgi:hypothetical protein
VLEGLKAPPPLADQDPVLVIPLTVAVSATVGVFEQSAGPDATLAVASVPKIIFTVSVTGGQAPLFVDINVKVTEPVAMSVEVIE